MAPDRFKILSDGDAREGTRYARVEVRSGDNPLTFCCGGTERAEVSYMQDSSSKKIYENENSGIQQYAFSVKFDPTWQTIVDYGSVTGNWTGAWGIFLQLHGPNELGTNPAWALSATDEIRFNMRTGDISKSANVYAYELRNGSLNKGKWIDFILTIKYAKGNDGFVTLARRDEGETSFAEVLNLQNISTLQYSSAVNGGAVGDHYIKHGLYRNRQPFTSVLYLDGFTRAAVSGM